MQDRGNVYQKLILAAKDHLDQHGSLPSSLAELGDLISIDESEVQNNFSSIEDLHEGLIYQGVVLLNDHLRSGILAAAPESPDAQLRSLARSYTEWAVANPALFRLIVEGLNQPMEPDATLYRFTMSMRDLCERKFNEIRQLGQLHPDTDIGAVLILMHCLVKGTNMVLLTREYDPWVKDDPRQTQRIAVDMFDYFLDNVLAANPPPMEPETSEAEMSPS